MGRAKGLSAATSTAAFNNVFGTHRGTAQSAMLERTDEPSINGARAIKAHHAQLEQGVLEPTVNLLREHADEWSDLPRISELRFMLSEHMRVKKIREHEWKQRAIFKTFGADSKLYPQEESTFDLAMNGWTHRGFSLKPVHTNSNSKEWLPDDVEFMDMMADEGYYEGLVQVLGRRLATNGSYEDRDQVFRQLLGAPAYSRLSQEAAGMWAREIPLGEIMEWNSVFDDSREGDSLSQLMTATQWQKLIRDYVNSQTRAGRPFFDKRAVMHMPKTSFEPAKKSDDYKEQPAYLLAKALRSLSRKKTDILKVRG